MNNSDWIILLQYLYFAALLIVVIFVTFKIKAEWPHVDEPEYRTADEDQMRRDIAQLQRVAKIAARHQAHKNCCELQSARLLAGDAARRDLNRQRGAEPTGNPHKQGGLLYAVWASQYKTTTEAYAEQVAS